MRRKYVLVLLAAVMLCGTVTVSCKKQLAQTDPVGPDRTLPYVHTNWMSFIDDDKYLSEFTIPGTHDCAADLHTSQQGTASQFVICQNFRLENQLRLGVRWFDVRLHLKHGVLTAYHGGYYLHKNFNDLLTSALTFLAAHPSEVVVFMIKQEGSSEADMEFAEVVYAYLASHGLEKFWLVKQRVPKLGEVRGKLMIVRQFDNDLGVDLGLHFKWDSNTTGGDFWADQVSIHVQDHYDLNHTSYDNKRTYIKNCVRAAHGETNRQKVYLNFVSGEEVNGLIDLETTTSNINPAVNDWLCTPPIYRKCGILMLNFAGGSDDGLIHPMFVQDLVYCNDLQVKVGNQTWMMQNLDVSCYRNGDPIPQVKSQSVWDTLTTGAWCYYNNDGVTGWNGFYYGKLYNWYAVNDPRGLAPAGWHIPSSAEWDALASFVGGDAVAGGKLKATCLWAKPNEGATDQFSFRALPAGWRESDSRLGDFSEKSHHGVWWTSTEHHASMAWGRKMDYDNTYLSQYLRFKAMGASVRVVKDQ